MGILCGAEGKSLGSVVPPLLPSNQGDAGKQELILMFGSTCRMFKTCHTPAMQVAKRVPGQAAMQKAGSSN